jgi:hypothetical protein
MGERRQNPARKLVPEIEALEETIHSLLINGLSGRDAGRVYRRLLVEQREGEDLEDLIEIVNEIDHYGQHLETLRFAFLLEVWLELGAILSEDAMRSDRAIEQLAFIQWLEEIRKAGFVLSEEPGSRAN